MKNEVLRSNLWLQYVSITGYFTWCHFRTS